MYGSVDNSWNDCINEKNLIIKNNKSYIASRDCFGTKCTGSCHVPTQLYMYVIELMQVNSKGGRELKGWPRGWSNLDSFRPE